jgi:hypothetical protein
LSTPKVNSQQNYPPEELSPSLEMIRIVTKKKHYPLNQQKPQIQFKTLPLRQFQKLLLYLPTVLAAFRPNGFKKTLKEKNAMFS